MFLAPCFTHNLSRPNYFVKTLQRVAWFILATCLVQEHEENAFDMPLKYFTQPCSKTMSNNEHTLLLKRAWCLLQKQLINNNKYE
jgi:hypothetical protein